MGAIGKSIHSNGAKIVWKIQSREAVATDKGALANGDEVFRKSYGSKAGTVSKST